VGSTGDVVVIGAGFAGAATAYHLVRLGVRDVVLVEQETMAGVHASSQNAGMARQTALAPAITPLAMEAVSFLREPPADWPLPFDFRPVGMLLLADGDQATSLRAAAESGRPGAGRWLSRDEVERRAPLTAGGAFAGAVFGAEDGVVDIAALLQGYLRAAARGGARLLTGQRVRAVQTEKGRVTAVETDRETIATRSVVDAAGAWAGSVAAFAGLAPPPLRPCRRHLFVSGPLPQVDRSSPIVWDLTHALYFRPEPPGLLLSPCDETDHAPGPVAVDSSAQELLASKLLRFFPRLADVPLVRGWAGLRTLTPDGNFLLGRDPRLEGFVWCAGLGGHGMTTSAAVGRIAAEAVLGKPGPKEHDPGRFVAKRN
jgi:glycine/D-amino acid oxidase-like deaminating enzyme